MAVIDAISGRRAHTQPHDRELIAELGRAHPQIAQSHARRIFTASLPQPRKVVLYPNCERLNGPTLGQELLCGSNRCALPAVVVSGQPAVLTRQLPEELEFLARIPGHEDDLGAIRRHADSLNGQLRLTRIGGAPA